ncbi:phosphatidylserine/phosphatidylglycerophosphate/cardiolipin synthase family protein [Methylibium sp.]|uniref:phospholipase D-like domain-containing protein n=1 Tax=Methylibium sp. TaxID=2067992 RepID=UPI0025CBE0C3|nr:phospholipase D-like domain-containing protein [Methylibium sp.]
MLLLMALPLAACTSLPRIVPDRNHGRMPVQVEAANGRILSASQSRALLDKRGLTGAQARHFERQLALEQEVSGSPLTTGNAAVLLQDGPATYAAMFAAIESARDHINLETFILDDDEVGRRFADVLLEKQRQGVQVNLIHDAVGTLSTPSAFFERLKRAGVRVVQFNPVNPLEATAGWELNNRDHRKLLIVDGTTAFVGGINISAVYSGSSPRGGRFGSSAFVPVMPRQVQVLPWRDTHVQLSGPVVATLQQFFMETWAQQKAEPLAPRAYFPTLSVQGKEVVRAIASSPEDPFSQFYATLISVINTAQDEILLSNAYFVPDPQLKQSLVDAVSRGVDVKIVLPSATDSSLVFHAGRAHYDELLRGGVKLYERQDVLLHSKTAVIDGVWSTVGSSNLDWRSFLHNQEVNVLMIGSEFGAQMQSAFQRDLVVSQEITLREWQRRGVVVRLKEFFGRLWEYWL